MDRGENVRKGPFEGEPRLAFFSFFLVWVFLSFLFFHFSFLFLFRSPSFKHISLPALVSEFDH